MSFRVVYISFMAFTYIVACMGIAGSCDAQVTEYFDRESWESAVNEFTTIGFTGYPWGHQITDEYAELGVLFTDGFDQVECCSFFLYPQDGAGLFGSSMIELQFSEPMMWIAADFPGAVKFDLYHDDVLLYSSTTFGVSGIGNFGGLVSDVPFDRAILTDPLGGVFIDDLHFGPSIPAPAVLPLLALMLRRDRRRSA